MSQRTIYQGSITVSASDYIHPVKRGDDYADVEIAGLDELVTRLPILSFTLDYPFDKPYEGTVVGDAGITLRQIIDALRHGFRVMYRGALHQEIPQMHNQLVDGDYGRAVHAIGDLVIESILLDEGARALHIGIGS